MQVLQRPARATRLASGLPLYGPMNVKIGAWAVSIAAAIGAGAAWFLEWPSATSAAVGAVLVPLVAVATGVVSSDFSRHATTAARRVRMWPRHEHALCE